MAHTVRFVSTLTLHDDSSSSSIRCRWSHTLCLTLQGLLSLHNNYKRQNKPILLVSLIMCNLVLIVYPSFPVYDDSSCLDVETLQLVVFIAGEMQTA